MTKGKIILLAAGVLILALCAAGALSVPGNSKLLQSAVYLEEAVVAPENEGQLVVIHGKPEMTKPVYDVETGLTLQTIKAFRYDEVYKQTGSTDEEKKWEWVSRGTRSIAGEAKIGEFQLDEEIILQFPAESDYDAFDKEEAARYYITRPSAGIDSTYLLPEDALYYSDIEALGDDSFLTYWSKLDTGRQREGTPAFRYRAYDPEKNGVVTVVGIQKGNMLMKAETNGAVFDGVKTLEELISANALVTYLGAGICAVPGIVCIFLALRKPHQKKEAVNA